ncbi:hypothetical protein [Gemmatimonas sp.]|uniref:hypothetical protein n=1 Tax=Gemmatimonas sp. TaxID=1962908 RepID=UPI00334233B6
MLLPDLPTSAADGEAIVPQSERSRLRLVRCQIERRPAARSRVSVEFEGPWFTGPLVCEQEGTTCPGGDLRLAARATLDALTTATQDALRFDLVGVKPSRAFDTNVMLVAVMVHCADESTKVLGVAVEEDNDVLATVRATLHAVNRFVSPILGPLPTTE